MSDTSSTIKMATKESTTRPTSVFDDSESVIDVESVISTAPQLPGAPPPTRAHTVAGADVPDYEYVQARLANTNISTPPTSVRAGVEDASLESINSQESASFMEASNWAELAEDDFLNALKRIATAAEDEHQADPSHSVEHYYLLRIAKLIKAGPIKINLEYLK